MKKILFISLSLCSLLAQGQAIQYLDANQVKASVSSYGYMFYDGANSSYEFPKGSGNHSASLGAIWLGGIKGDSQLCVSAQQYPNATSDFWPGPYGAPSTVNTPWDRVWKINKSTLDSFIMLRNQQGINAVANNPQFADIRDWPGQGSTDAKGKNGISLASYMQSGNNFAPFHDGDQNGIYDWRYDYPLIKGSQTLWWIFHDDTLAHTYTAGSALQVDCAMTVWACDAPGIENTTYYQMRLKQHQSGVFDDLQVGFYLDGDIGSSFDDYIGSDTSRNALIFYNALDSDFNYGKQLTQLGLALIDVQPSGPSYTTNKNGIYFNNVFTGPLSLPQSYFHYYNYLTGFTADGQKFTNDFQGPNVVSDGFGQGSPTSYVFWDNPLNVNGWSELSCSNPAGDRRVLLTHSFYGNNIPVTSTYTWALTNSPLSPQKANFPVIASQIDDAKMLMNGCASPNSIISNANGVMENLDLYPNPTSSTLYCSGNLEKGKIKQVWCVDVLGRNIALPYKYENQSLSLDVKGLPAGTYSLLMEYAEQKITVGRFTKI